jgi:hypothetical protein
LKSIFLYFISLIGGINLLAFELITSKLIAPIYGTSFHVWSVTLFVTLLGIALGYYFSSKLMKFNKDAFILISIHIFIAISLYFIEHYAYNILLNFIESSFLTALISSVLLIFLPIYIFFVSISPMMISLLSKFDKNPNKLASIIFSLSTMGGVIGIYLFGFYLIPMKGLSISLMFIQGINAFNLIILIIMLKFVFKNVN